ncbi:Scr1 family TA system antitoxin-like transcriptional regulator [Saccharopolyspora hattusasensis]|uniref:Scr1 family TA system antitoxin-like transcriptional regulator n=1 Tax=Saccharopolyspora hattusasensis TaxID=1128679 RepID=UPI003D9949D1
MGDEVALRVFRFDSGWHPGLEGPFHVIETREGTIIHLEKRKSGLFLHEDPDVRAYRRAADHVLEVAMSKVESVKLIRHIANSMEGSRDH